MSKSSHTEVFSKKGVLRNFTKFTGQHKRQSLFIIKLQADSIIIHLRMAVSIYCKHSRFCAWWMNASWCSLPTIAINNLNLAWFSGTFFSYSSFLSYSESAFYYVCQFNSIRFVIRLQCKCFIKQSMNFQLISIL